MVTMPRQINLKLLDEDYVIVGPKTKNTSQAKRIINKNKLGTPSDPKNTDTGIYDMLTTMGVTVSSLNEKNFSFKQILENEESVNNPKILEKKDFKKFKNDKIPSKDKFSNEDDPFYELDNAREINTPPVQAISTINKNDLVSEIGTDIINLNISSTGVVKQFGSLE